MLQSVVIEVRQHLCCANVFLKFKQSLTDLESLKIRVDEFKVLLEYAKYRADIFINKYFSILDGTFCNFIVDIENASFRVSIKDVNINKEPLKEARNCVNLNLNEKDEAVSVVCSNCESLLVSSQQYDKIREFPSGAIDVSEFFCHHAPSYTDVLVPSSKDIFYGFQFIVVNKAVTDKNIREKEDHLYCKRCLRYLGITLLNGRAAKLWCDSIRFHSKGKFLEIFTSDDKSQIYELLLKAIEETSLPSPEHLLRNMHFTKVLLEASFPNRQQRYLLVHILEKHLPVLRNLDKINECKDNQNDPIELKKNKAFKILYRLIGKDVGCNEKEKEVTNSCLPLLEYWQQNINILKMSISPFLFKALNDELDRNVYVLPKIYRLSNDGFLLSYIFY